MATDPDLPVGPNADSRVDLPVDGHLRTALRHAPDHDAAPPAALSQAIRAAAHAAVPAVPAGPVPPLPWWQRWWWASGRPHGPWGAGLASLAVVAVTLGLWRGQEIPPPVASPEAARPSARAAAPPAAPAAPAATMKAASPGDTPVVLASAPAPAVVAEATAPAPKAPKTATASRPRAATAQETGGPMGPPSEPPAAAATVPALAAATAAPPLEMTDAKARADRQAAGRAANISAATQEAAAMPLRRLPPWLMEPGRQVQWRDGDGAAEAAGPAARAWLQRLDSAAAGHWQAGPGPLDEAVSRHLRWLQDERPIAEALVLASGVRFIDATTRSAWYVALPASELEALRQR